MQQKILKNLFLVFTLGLMLTACTETNHLKELEKEGYVCNNYSKQTPNQMGRNTVVKMVSNYYQNQYSAINQSAKAGQILFPDNCPVDSRAVFMNIDSLKKLLYYLETASKGYSDAEKRNLGVNIYFGSYTKDMNMTENGYDLMNRHTLICIPSIFDSTKKMARDIDLMANINNKSVAPRYIDAAFFGVNKPIALAKGGSGDSTIFAQNHGSLVPPPPDPSNNPLLNITGGN
jgi:hypothetical protein